MNYLVLPENLRSTADVIHNYLTKDIGLPKINIECSIDDRIEYRPTFYAVTRDHHFFCVDVSDNIYNPTRWIFISDCEHNCRPLKFYIALPSIDYASFPGEMKKAKDAGVGILEVSTRTQHCEEISPAISLSLCGLRKFDRSAFPKRYREVLANAEATFKNGSPSKACSMIYDEIESLTRKIVYQAHKKGCLKQPISNPEDLLERTAWATVLDHLNNRVVRTRGSKYSVLSNALISQVQGITPHRNQSGHKPNSIKKLMIRDSQLRTRMETAVDLLLELSTTTQTLRIT
jgi:hypothetical protein